MRARYYDANVGRFISEDPAGFAGGLNLYAYVGGNPIMLVDPSGLGAEGIIARTRNTIAAFGETVNKIVGASSDFLNNYNDMRDANTIGADKYFHCKANCQAAQIGQSGTSTAEIISNYREWVDMNIKGDPASASAADQAANLFGRTQGAQQANSQCSQLCAPYRPNGLDPKY
jgi:uncharacterized protein RhaS with RHS repeats